MIIKVEERRSSRPIVKKNKEIKSTDIKMMALMGRITTRTRAKIMQVFFHSSERQHLVQLKSFYTGWNAHRWTSRVHTHTHA